MNLEERMPVGKLVPYIKALDLGDEEWIFFL